MLVIAPVRRAALADAYEARIGYFHEGAVEPVVIRAYGATKEAAMLALQDIVWRMHGALCHSDIHKRDGDELERVTW